MEDATKFERIVIRTPVSIPEAALFAPQLLNYRLIEMKRLILCGLSAVTLGITCVSGTQAQTTGNSSRSVGNGDVLNYPSGSRIYRNGSIQPSSGKLINPNVTITNGDGSTTFYYSNGTRVRVNRNSISPSGSYLSPNQPNGGLRNPATTRPSPFLIPNRQNNLNQ